MITHEDTKFIGSLDQIVLDRFFELYFQYRNDIDEAGEEKRKEMESKNRSAAQIANSVQKARKRAFDRIGSRDEYDLRFRQYDNLKDAVSKGDPVFIIEVAERVLTRLTQEERLQNLTEIMQSRLMHDHDIKVELIDIVFTFRLWNGGRVCNLWEGGSGANGIIRLRNPADAVALKLVLG